MCVRRVVPDRLLRQADLLYPPALLLAATEGPNSRRRVFALQHRQVGFLLGILPQIAGQARNGAAGSFV